MRLAVLLALILSGLQIVVFTLLAIPYGVLFAVAIGFTTLVPYASALTIVLVSVLLALEDPRTGLEVLGLEQPNSDGPDVAPVVLQCRSVDDGNAVTLRASWVIGCDGARSTVRKALASRRSPRVRNGVPLLPRKAGSPPLTMAAVNKLRDE